MLQGMAGGPESRQQEGLAPCQGRLPYRSDSRAEARRRRSLGRDGKSMTSSRNCTCRGPVARGDKEDQNKVIVARVGQEGSRVTSHGDLRPLGALGVMEG